MISRVVLALMMASVAGSPILAAEPKYETQGVGLESCGSWLEARNSNSSDMMEQWVLGFASAATFLISAAKNESVGYSTDVNGMLYWVDNYCRENPTQAIQQAAVAFVFSSKTMDFAAPGDTPSP